MPMGQEGRSNEAQRKQEKNRSQRRPVLKRGEAKEMHHGRVDKVVPEEKNRKGDENDEGNQNETSRPQRAWGAARGPFNLQSLAAFRPSPLRAVICGVALPPWTYDANNRPATRLCTHGLDLTHRFHPVFMHLR